MRRITREIRDQRPFVFELDLFPTLLPDLALGLSNGGRYVGLWRGRSVLFHGMRGTPQPVVLDMLRKDLGVDDAEVELRCPIGSTLGGTPVAARHLSPASEMATADAD
jgi:hypothetical protein